MQDRFLTERWLLVKDISPGSMVIEKADLFFALVRLYQLLRDVSLADTSDDITLIPDVEAEGDPGDEDVLGDESEVTYPTPFGNFLDEHDYLIQELSTAYGNEFSDLFAILATPLLVDPGLRDEFTRFALEGFGEEIVFTVASPPKAKLTLVPPLAPSSGDPDVPPETPTS
jgi:hypothetical protein